MLTIYLVYSAAVVAANPLFQRLPIQFSQTCPSQTCPSQTCPSQTCPSQTCPSQACPASPSQACPNQVLPPCQACQNNGIRNVFASVPVLNQPSKNCPCNQPAATQNPVTNPAVNQEILKQVMLSRLLSPQLQMLMNPNRVCNQCEAQTTGVPNIINNYIIIPPEYFKTNKTNDYRDKGENNKRRYRGRIKQQRQMVQNGESVREDDGELLSETHENESGRRRQNGSRKRGRPRKHEEDVSECSDETDEEYECDLSNENSDFKVADEPVINERLEPKRAEENSKSMHKMLVDNIIKLIQRKQEVPTNQRQIAENYTNGNPGQRKINTARVKNVEEAIIKDFCTKNPTIPEDIARSLLATLKLQALIPESSHYQPDPYVPFGNGQYFPPMFNPAYQTTTQENRPQRENRPRSEINGAERRNQNKKEDRHDRKEECDNCEKIVELNPTFVNTEAETITMEKIKTARNPGNNDASKIISEQKIETFRDLIGKLEAMKDKFTKINEIETTTVKYNKFETYPELGKEDKMLTIYENDVGDYYPDFKDIACYASEEEPDRYHYTTNRNGVSGGKRNEQRYVNLRKHNLRDINSELKGNPNIGKTNFENTLPTTTEKSNKCCKERVADKSVEITFRSPPLLELPDFETKQIKYASQEINDKFVADNFDKTSVHSDAKLDSRVPENDLTPVKVFSKDKKGRTSIETVYGHSKVVKYGQDAEGAGSTPVITYYLPEEAMTEERIQLPDGKLSVVVAKSIGNFEEIWN